MSSEKEFTSQLKRSKQSKQLENREMEKKHFKQGLERFGNKSDSGSYVTGGYGLTVLEGAGSSK